MSPSSFVQMLGDSQAPRQRVAVQAGPRNATIGFTGSRRSLFLISDSYCTRRFPWQPWLSTEPDANRSVAVSVLQMPAQCSASGSLSTTSSKNQKTPVPFRDERPLGTPAVPPWLGQSGIENAPVKARWIRRASLTHSRYHPRGERIATSPAIPPALITAANPVRTTPPAGVSADDSWVHSAPALVLGSQQVAQLSGPRFDAYYSRSRSYDLKLCCLVYHTDTAASSHARWGRSCSTRASLGR